MYSKRLTYKLEMGLLKIVILFGVWVIPVSGKENYGPNFMDNMTTTCEEFSRTARFNPYTMFNETWFVFYYWAPVTEVQVFLFTPVSSKQSKMLHERLEGRYSPPVNWTARHFLMWQRREMALLVENGDRGQFLMYSPEPAPVQDKKLSPIDFRFKQTGDNKVVGLLVCEAQKLYAMSRVEDVPRQKDLKEVASRLNYRGRGGKSYLYQGSQWMPIPEQDEVDFWSRRKKRIRKFIFHD